MIRPIDGKSVHRICSGQVVLTLGVAIKELVENSLDAGATHIEIKLKGYGTTLVQVSDNGSGIAEADYEGLTLKHHTSKIRVFDDLPGVETFGFRGEALSSLCAVSDLSIHTKDSVTSVGTKLEYDGNGRIKRRQTLPRGQQGTTVYVSNLFLPLPVRRKEFERNAKREMGRAINFVTAYCLIHPDVRFSFTHQDTRSVSNLLSTDGRGTCPADCFASVFGPRLLHQVLKIEMAKELPETVAEEFRVKMLVQDHRICGWISSPTHGLGRSSPDRQFIFINKRPCEVQRVTRLVNEVYRELNRHQYPFLLLDITMSRDEVDVNVTPDKRSIFFDKESHLLALIKASVMQTLKGATPIVPTIAKAPVSDSCSEESIFAILKRKVEESKKASGVKQQRLSFSHAPKPSPLSFMPQCKLKTISVAPCGDDSTVLDVDGVGGAKITQECSVDNDVEMNNLSQTSSTDKRVDVDEVMESSEPAADKTTIEAIASPEDLEMKNCEGDKENSIIENSQTNIDTGNIFAQSKMTGETMSSGRSQTTITSQNLHKIESDALLMGVMDDDEAVPGKEEIKEADWDTGRRHCQADVNFSLENLRRRLTACPEKGAHQEHEGRKFLAKIDPGENGQAEEELQRHLKKSDFVKMKVIGQFNLGFIVAELDGDLFIVDQHATDEKFNFERLQREHVMEYQSLIRPQTLELSVPQEMIVLENLEVFEKNGFRFKINEEAPAGRKIDLISTPVSRNWDFGISDIEEMIFVLEETRTTSCRPSKVRRMLASRACRSSIMIGTALNTGEMKKLLDHMAEMDVPWSCPHGRPTIRHLGNLSLLRLATEGT